MAEGFKQFLMSHRGFSLAEAEAACRELESRMQPVSSGTDFQSLLESFVQTQKTLTAELTEAVRGVDGEDISRFREFHVDAHMFTNKQIHTFDRKFVNSYFTDAQ